MTTTTAQEGTMTDRRPNPTDYMPLDAIPYACQGYATCGTEDGQEVHAAACQNWNVRHGYQPVRPTATAADAPVEPTEQDTRVIAAYDAARAQGHSPLVAAKMAVAAVAQAEAAEQTRLEGLSAEDLSAEVTMDDDEPQGLPFGALVGVLKGNTVDLSEAATWVVVAVTAAKDPSMDAYERGHIDGSKRAALNVWTALTGIHDQEEAIAAAVALSRSTTRAHVAPF